METEYQFGTGEIEAVLATDAETRYRYFIKRVADWEQVWSLRNTGGWVLTETDDGQQVAPFWPFQAFAQRAAVGQWADTEPTSIPSSLSWSAGCRALPAMSGWSAYCPEWMGAAQSSNPWPSRTIFRMNWIDWSSRAGTQGTP